MTNGEKYKTDEERFVNFDKFCKEELLPCPFCGGEAILNSSVESWVECRVCHNRTEMCACDGGAIEKWNRRTKNEILNNNRKFKNR